MTEALSDDDYHAHWYGPDVATFGDRLAASREFIGMTQEEFALRLGVRADTVAEWEDDLSEPRANRLSMMSGLLNVSIGWLLTGEGEGVSEPTDDDATGDPDLSALLSEVRDARADLKATYDRLGRLEKRLRLKLKVTAHD